MKSLKIAGGQVGVVMLVAGGLGGSLAVQAQTLPPATVPNAGSILQQRKAQTQELEQEAPKNFPPVPSSKKVKRFLLKGVEFVGNERVGRDELQALLASYIGRELTEHDLDEMSDQISNLYREHGYGFTFTSVDPASVESGQVRFMIVEGKAGRVKLTNHSRVRNGLLEGLLSPFRAHTENTDSLERAQMLMADVPGVGAVHPRVTRGEGKGTVDVDMEVQPAPLVSGYASIDNYGSRTSGRTRLSAMLGLSNPFGLGDVLRVNVSGFPFSQNGDSTLGGFTYDLPVGNRGLRMGGGYNRLQYHLGGIYADQFDGTADVWSAYMSYPIVRQQRQSLMARLSYSHSLYKDNQVGFENQRSSDTVALSLSGSRQDTLFGRAGASRLSATLTYGNLRYDSPQFAQQDALGSKTAGGYGKFELSFGRTQQLTTSTYLQAEINTQYAFKNLDGSARLVMGGPSAVRAFSSDFISVDSGIVARGTLGWRLPFSMPVNVYTFYDMATGVLRHSPMAGQQNNVNLQGAGVGIEASYRSVSASLNFATRVGGNVPGIGDQPKNWTWLSLSYMF